MPNTLLLLHLHKPKDLNRIAKTFAVQIYKNKQKFVVVVLIKIAELLAQHRVADRMYIFN